MKKSKKFLVGSLVVALFVGIVGVFAFPSSEDLTGRVKAQDSRNKAEIRQLAEDTSVLRERANNRTPVIKGKPTNTERSDKEYEDYIGNGKTPSAEPIIETYIGTCNNPFGSPTCVFDGDYRTFDLAYVNDEEVMEIRVKNPSTSDFVYMDKIFLEYGSSGLDNSNWSRTDWKIYDVSSGSLLTRGLLMPVTNDIGYVSFDWSYPGNPYNPIIQPGAIPPGGMQKYYVTANILDDAAGPLTTDYIQAHLHDNFVFTPVVGGTLADAHSVNSHFIWHDQNGQYYNEAYVSLQDMWGNVPSAFSQWRKKMWATPAATLDIQIDPAQNPIPLSAYAIYPQAPTGTQDKYVSRLELTANGGDVEVTQLVFNVNANIINDENGVAITPAVCNNLSAMQTIFNAKLPTFNLYKNYTTQLGWQTNNAFALGTTYNAPGCAVDYTVTLLFNDVINQGNTEIYQLEVEPDPAMIHNNYGYFYNDNYVFDINNYTTNTVAYDVSSGTQLIPSQITGPSFMTDFNAFVDMTLVSISPPTSSTYPWPMTATQGEDDVLLGVFNVINWATSMDVTMNELVISDELIGIANSDISNLRIYEWDFATNLPIGAPLASGLNMGPSNAVTAQNLNFTLGAWGSGNWFFGVMGDISPSFDTDAGYDVLYDAGTATDDNELHIGLHDNGLSNALTAAVSIIPFDYWFADCTSNPNPFLGCGSAITNDITLGNLVDVIEDMGNVIVNFEPTPNSQYYFIEVPTGSGINNAVKVADIEVVTTSNIGLNTLNDIVLSNDDNAANYSARFGTFYLVDEGTGAVIDTASLIDSGGDAVLDFSGINWVLTNAYHSFDIYAEVNPVVQASHSGSYAKLYLASNTTADFAIEDLNGTTYPASSVFNNASDSDIYLQTHVVRRSEPTISYNNGIISTSITGTTSSKEVYAFNISADPQGDIEWNKLTFNVAQTSGVQISDLDLYIVGQSTPIATVSGNLANGEVALLPTMTQSITAGSTVNYILKASLTVTNTVNSQSASFELTAADDTSLITDTHAGVISTSPDFIWSDRSGISHSLFTPDWTNGFMVDVFDVETTNIVYQGTN